MTLSRRRVRPQVEALAAAFGFTRARASLHNHNHKYLFTSSNDISTKIGREFVAGKRREFQYEVTQQNILA